MSDLPIVDRGARALGWSRAALGLLLVVRTTPLSRVLPWDASHVAPFLLGWPEHGFRAAWLGFELPDAAVYVLCIVRTVAAASFALGVSTRTAGTVAALAAFAVLSQDAFGFKFTLYTLFMGTWLLAISGSGRVFALRPSSADRVPASPWLVRAFVASVYAWAGIAKCRGSWLSGETLHALYAAHYLTGAASDFLFASLGRCRAAAWAVVVTELSLGPLLLARRTRVAGIVLAIGMHAIYEWTAQPDVYGLVMAALLLSFVDNRPRQSQRDPVLAGRTLSRGNRAPRNRLLVEDLEERLDVAIALAKSADQRFTTPRELAEALAAARRGALSADLRTRADALLRERPWASVSEPSSTQSAPALVGRLV